MEVSRFLGYVLLLLVCIPQSEQAACADGTDFVGQLTSDFPYLQDANTDKGFLLTDAIGVVQCYGVVKHWRMRCHNNGRVVFQVWRPISGDNYALVGEQEYTSTDCELARMDMFRNPFFLSYCTQASNHLNTLGGFCNNQVSSLQLSGNQDWRVYYGQNWAGGSDLLSPGVYNNPGSFTGDDIESVQREGILVDTPELPNWNKIPVRPGDVIGFVQKDNTEVIQFSESASGSSACCETRTQGPVFSPTVASQYSWPAGASVRRQLPFQAVLQQGQTPQLLNLPDTIQLAENVAIGHTVYTVESQDWNEEYNQWGDTITYTMTHANFQVDASTGVITTTSILDFETAPGNQYTLDVTVSDGELTDTETLTIQLVDINEPHSATNLPTWLTIDAQTVTAGDRIGGPFQLTVTDVDATTNLQWVLLTHTPADGTFTLVDIGGNQAEVECTQTLAFWDVDRYVLQVAAADTDGTFTTGPLNLTIEIININLAPYFLNLPGTTTVPEDSTAAGLIYTIQAVDPEGDALIFTRVSTYPPTDAAKFTFNAATQEVGISANPGFDYETLQHYTINFTVSDPGGHVSNEATLNVDISDVNEPPTCVPANLVTTVNEKLPIGSIIANLQLNVTDEDLSHGDYITYSVQAGTGDEHYAATGDRLEMLKVIDLGTDPDTMHGFDVHGVDSGGLTCTTFVNITVINVNDQHYITNLPDEISVNAQTTGTGTVVFTIDVAPVEDFDIFTYRLDSSDPTDGLFHLNVTTGDIIMSSGSFSDWTEPKYELYYSVLDQDGLIDGPKLLTVYIVNRKDPPKIYNLPTTISLPESLTGVNLVFTVQASDADGDAILGYTLVDYDPLATTAKFSFNTNGELSTVATPDFDYESLTTFTLVFTARDYLYTSENKSLTIIISDVNEDPQFGVSAYSVRIPEELAVGTKLSLSPHAFDVIDEDKNDNLTFQIIGDPYSDYFSLSYDTLVVGKRMDSEAAFPSSVNLRVVARDHAGLEAIATVGVTIYDVNDNPPVFNSDTYFGKIQENTFGGTSVLTVQASDADSGKNGQFSYVIDDTGNGTVADIFFQVDSSTGIIRTKHQADYDKYPMLVFDVLAVDEGTPTLTGTTTVTILVTDVNDIRPHFEDDFFNLAVPCNEDEHTQLARISATDDDTVSNLTYYYLKYNAYFAVGAESGVISVNQGLQCQHKYVLYLLAKDNGTPNRISKRRMCPDNALFILNSVAVARVDSYKPSKYLVDIELAVPINEYRSIEENFLKELHDVLDPWNITIVKVVGETDLRGSKRKLLALSSDDTQTVVTILATETTLTDDVANVPLDKDFVEKEKLLDILQEDSDGTPADVLKSTEFGDFYVTKVSPTHTEGNWITDTDGGRALLAMICLLVLALLVLLLVCLCVPGVWSRFRDACKRAWEDCNETDRQNVRFINVTNPPATASNDGFRLRYKNPEEYHHKTGVQAHKSAWLSGVFANRFRRRVSTPPDQAGNRGRSLNSQGRPTTREDANGSPPHSAAYNHWRDERPPSYRSLTPATPRHVTLMG